MLYVPTLVQVNLFVLNMLLGLWIFGIIIIYPIIKLIDASDRLLI